MKARISLLLKFLLLGSLLAFALSSAAKDKAPRHIKVYLLDGQHKTVGTATLSQASNGVKIRLRVHDLAPGEHGIHIHQNPKCNDPDFKSAGGHLNPDGKNHGLQNPEGPHAGDIPNFTVDAKGRAKTSVIAPNVTLTDGPHSVFSGGGTALVIHAKADDGKTDPSGNSGDRIACGVIRRIPGIIEPHK